MNYLRIYNELIDNAKQRKEIEGYTEKHHIIPKCIGGEDVPENIVELTAREHFLAHWLLAREYGGKLWYAFKFMCTGITSQHERYTPSSRVIAEARENFSKAQTGRNHSESTKRKIAKAWLGKKNPQQSRRMKLRNPNSIEDVKEKQRAAKLGDKNSSKRPEVREKLKYSNNKPVREVTTNRVFYSTAEASRVTGYTTAQIGNDCRGRTKLNRFKFAD